MLVFHGSLLVSLTGQKGTIEVGKNHCVKLLGKLVRELIFEICYGLRMGDNGVVQYDYFIAGYLVGGFDPPPDSTARDAFGDSVWFGFGHVRRLSDIETHETSN